VSIIEEYLLKRPRYHRLTRVSDPTTIGGEVGALLKTLYEGTTAEYLAAVYLNSAITERKPVAILSRNDLETLVLAHKDFELPYSRQVSLKARTLTVDKKMGNAYQGFLGLITKDTSWVKKLNSPSRGSKEPLALEITHKTLLQATGAVDSKVREAAVRAAALCKAVQSSDVQ
jgi:hypothetical protein